MRQETVAVHFELYALRQGRWVMDACFADEDEALAAAQRTRRATDVRGVRVLRELSLPGAPEPVVTIAYDSTQKEAPLVFRASPAAAASPAARANVADDDRSAAMPAPGPYPAPAVRSGNVGFVLGATGFAFAAVAAVLALL